MDTEIARPDDFHVTALLRSCVVPSLNLPVAVSCILVPSPSFVRGAVMLMEDSLAVDTVKLVEAVGLPNCAPIRLDPAVTVVVFPAMGLVATAVSLEVHLVATTAVRSCTLPPKSPVAWNWTGIPIGSVGAAVMESAPRLWLPTVSVDAGLFTTVVPFDRVTAAVTLQLPGVLPTLANPFEIDVAMPVGEHDHCVDVWVVRS